MVGRVEREAVSDDDRVLDGFEDCSAPIMVERRAKVPTRNGTGAKGGSCGRFLVKQEFGSWGRKWSAVEIEGTEKMVVGRQM